MAMPLFIVSLIKKGFRFLEPLARLTRKPVIGAMTDKMLFDGDDMMYLAKDRVIKVGRAVENEGGMVLPSQVVDHFIDRTDYHWVMDKCICRDAEGCEDYPQTLGCLFLGRAAMGINPRLGRRVSADEAKAHVKRCREAGLVHVIGRNKLDTAWLGVGPGRQLLTVCNCCPCCCLWRALPHLDPRIADKITAMPGVTVEVTGECEGCGVCESSCFAGAVKLENGRAVITDQCRGCGRCVDLCPQNAITLTVKDDSYVTDAIARIERLVELG